MASTRPYTFRVENIPPGTTAEELIKYFYTEDQPRVQIRSIVPAVDSYELDIQEYTATVTFQTLKRNGNILLPRSLNEDIIIDGEFHGFTPLNHPPEPIAADIIAVTGLAAHAFGSWAHSAQKMWLRDYLPRDVSNARVLIYGYPSQLHGNTSRSILSDHSTDMIHRLLTMREMAKCQDRPIVFIGHSLGCLIIKKALCDINGSVGIYSSQLPVRSIIFMGAPHKGLETTALETLVKSQATEDMIRELKSESPTLTELNDKFRHVAKNVDILTCYELSPTKTVIKLADGTWASEGPPMMMVSQDSARQWYPREELLPCNADHSQMAKLKRGESGIYPSIRWAIRKALLSAGDLYSETKGLHNNESGNLGSADETFAIGRSLLQVPYRLSSVPSDNRTAILAPAPSRAPSEDVVDHRRPPQVKAEQFDHHGDTRSKKNPLNESVPHWRTGLENSEWDDTRSSANPTNSAETDMASVSLDEDTATSKSTEMTKPLSADPATYIKTKEETSPDLEKKEGEDDTALQREDFEISTNSTKSMVMDEVMLSAIKTGNEVKTRELIAHCYDVNCKGDGGITPLLLAACYKHESILRLLLEHGANPSVRSDNGNTTLHWLALKPEIPVSETLIDLLLRNRPPFDVANCEGVTPLMNACTKGELLLATKLMDHGASIEASDRDGWRPLHFALRGDHLEIVKALLDHGAIIEASNIVGWRPLHLATYSGQLKIVKALLDHGADIEASGTNGWRSLHCATYQGHLEIVKELLNHGANPTVRTTPLVGSKPSGMSMVDSVTSSRQQSIRALLKEAEKKWKQSHKK